MKLLLDMYKGVSKEQRDKVQFMATEKKLRSEIDDLRNQLKKVQVSDNAMTTKLCGATRSFGCCFVFFLSCRKANVKNERS